MSNNAIWTWGFFMSKIPNSYQYSFSCDWTIYYTYVCVNGYYRVQRILHECRQQQGHLFPKHSGNVDDKCQSKYCDQFLFVQLRVGLLLFFSISLADYLKVSNSSDNCLSLYCFFFCFNICLYSLRVVQCSRQASERCCFIKFRRHFVTKVHCQTSQSQKLVSKIHFCFNTSRCIHHTCIKLCQSHIYIHVDRINRERHFILNRTWHNTNAKTVFFFQTFRTIY